jgi:hypothetical protein
LHAQATMHARTVQEDRSRDARNHARSLKGTPESERSSNARKKVEMRFTHLKVQHGFERMRLRGLTGARDEFHLAAIVQNLKTMALRLLGPPTDGVSPRRLRKWRMAIRSGCSPAQGSDARPGVTAKPFLNGKANYGRAFFDSIDPFETWLASCFWR